MAATWTKSTWTGWSVMTFLSIAVAGYGAVAAFLSLDGSLPSMTHHIPERATAAALHFGIGGLALILGPWQFLPALRRKVPVVHRWVGRLYVLSCLVSGCAALVLSRQTITGLDSQIGFVLLATLWLITTLIGWKRARDRDFVAHRQWMIRSFALTLAAVTLRFYLPLSQVLEIPFQVAYPIISYACWVPNILVAEWMIRRTSVKHGNDDRDRQHKQYQPADQ